MFRFVWACKDRSMAVFSIFYFHIHKDTPNKVAEKTDTNNIRTEEKYVPYEEWRNAMIKRAESELKNQKAK